MGTAPRSSLARIGVLVEAPVAGSPAGMAEAVADWAAAERDGFGAIWLRSVDGSGDGARLFGAALAEATTCARIGLVAAPSITLHPLRLAEDLAMIDITSHGRLDWIPLRGPTLSLAEHAEYVQVVVEAWRGEAFAHAGERWQFPELVCVPSPEQHPHPAIWLEPDAPRPDSADAGMTGTWIEHQSALAASDRRGARAIVCRLGDAAGGSTLPDTIVLSRDATRCRTELASLQAHASSDWLIVACGGAEGDNAEEEAVSPRTHRRWLVDEVLSR